MQIRIQLDTKPVLNLLNDMPKEVIPVASARALNKTLTSVQSVAIKTIAKDIGVKQATIRKSFALEKAYRARLKAYLRVIKAKRLSLIEIDPRAKQMAQGVCYRGENGQRNLIPGAFIAVMKSGHRGVFKRLGKARLPIHELQGVSVQNVFLKSVIQTLLQDQAKIRWQEVLPHELQFECQRRGHHK